MDIAELKNKLDNIAAELAEQDVQQEDITIEDAHSKDMEKHLPLIMKMKKELMDKGIGSEDAMDRACAKYGFDPDDVGEYLKKDEAVVEDAERMIKVTNVEWDADNPADVADLPTDFILKVGIPYDADEDEVDEIVSDAITDRYGFTHKGFEMKFAEDIEETVEVPVSALAELMQLAGYENYADTLEEYENEPEEQYHDAEDQLIGLAGGLNGPKKMYPASADGDNPMDQEPREIEEDAISAVEESLYKSYKEFLEAEIETKK